jgi:hypothetical protein
MWRGRNLSTHALQALCAKWEIELANAGRITGAAEQMKHVYLATSDLITNAGDVVTSESEGFFSGLQFPQSDRTTKKR